MTHIGGLLITATGSVLLTAKEVKEVEGHIDQLEAENDKLRELGKQYELVIVDYRAEVAKLRELVSQMYNDMQGVLDMSTDTVWVDNIGTLRDRMDYHMQDMAELGMPPADYEKRMHELGIEVDG